MFNGVYIGENAERQKKRLLIMGESHYGNTTSSQSVVADRYFQFPHDRSYRFFENIVRDFGYDTNDRVNFWNKVYFGNYLDSLCGIRDGTAQKRVYHASDRIRLNQQLFNTVNEMEIDVLFCFSRLAFYKLPPLQNGVDIDCGCLNKTETKKYQVYKCIYQCKENGPHGISLHKPLIVYSFTHPSAYYSYKRHQQIVEKIVRDEGLLTE